MIKNTPPEFRSFFESIPYISGFVYQEGRRFAPDFFGYGMETIK